MKPKTIRLSEGLERFTEESDYNFSADVRQSITNDSIRYAVGKCAVTGDILFTGSFATVGTTTPIGKALDAPTELDTINLRENIFSDVSKQISQEGGDIPALEYLEQIGPVLYQAESQAIADAQPDDSWSLTASVDKQDLSLSRRVEDSLLWSKATEQEGYLSIQNIWDHTPEFAKERTRDYVENSANPEVASHAELIEIVKYLGDKP